MNSKKIYKPIKFILFFICGLLVFIFNKQLMNHDGAILNGVVGTVMAYYGLEGILIPIVTKKVKKEQMRMLAGVTNLLLAIIMIFLLEGNTEELRIVCVLWSVWSIMREGEEIFEKSFTRFKRHPFTSLINLAESIIVIIFSIELICAKDFEHLLEHAHVHLILLGIELILEVVWEHIDELEELIIKRIKKQKREKGDRY